MAFVILAMFLAILIPIVISKSILRIADDLSGNDRRNWASKVYFMRS